METVMGRSRLMVISTRPAHWRGVGLCGREGLVTCVAGRLSDSCEPGELVGGDRRGDGQMVIAMA